MTASAPPGRSNAAPASNVAAYGLFHGRRQPIQCNAFPMKIAPTELPPTRQLQSDRERKRVRGKTNLRLMARVVIDIANTRGDGQLTPIRCPHA